jgi:hypothetical protein
MGTSVPTYADIHGLKKKRRWGKWNTSSVHRMLKYETYAGLWHYGKRRRDADGQWTQNPDDNVPAVEVPAIVDRELWEATQLRLAENKQTASRNRKYDYLLSRRVSCGGCGCRMHGASRKSPTSRRLYYVCPATNHRDMARDCNAPSFRADQVDAAVWEWVKSFLTDPEALAQGLWEVQQEREQENAPIRERLAVVDDLLADNRAQLERLLDLYLSGEFPKEALVDRKSRLEVTISALERERVGPAAHLETQVLSVEQVQTIQDLAEKIGKNLETMDDDFSARRRLIKELNVQVTLAVEDSQKATCARCTLEDCVTLHPRPGVV